MVIIKMQRPFTSILTRKNLNLRASRWVDQVYLEWNEKGHLTSTWLMFSCNIGFRFRWHWDSHWVDWFPAQVARFLNVQLQAVPAVFHGLDFQQSNLKLSEKANWKLYTSNLVSLGPFRLSFWQGAGNQRLEFGTAVKAHFKIFPKFEPSFTVLWQRTQSQ